MSIMCVESREWMKLGGKAFFCFTVSGFLQHRVGDGRSWGTSRAKDESTSTASASQDLGLMGAALEGPKALLKRRAPLLWLAFCSSEGYQELWHSLGGSTGGKVLSPKHRLGTARAQ